MKHVSKRVSGFSLVETLVAFLIMNIMWLTLLDIQQSVSKMYVREKNAEQNYEEISKKYP